MPEREFWTLTPRQLVRVFSSRGIEMTRRRNEAMALAWHIAALGRLPPRKFPKLSSLLVNDHRQRARQQDWKQMKSVAAQWAIALGGKVINHGHR